MPTFSFTNKQVIISGIDVSGVVVYSMDGTKCGASIGKSGGAVTVDLSSLPAGNYIVKTSVNSFKVHIR